MELERSPPDKSCYEKLFPYVCITFHAMELALICFHVDWVVWKALTIAKRRQKKQVDGILTL